MFVVDFSVDNFGQIENIFFPFAIVLSTDFLKTYLDDLGVSPVLLM